jgi:hypothetical protein
LIVGGEVFRLFVEDVGWGEVFEFNHI